MGVKSGLDAAVMIDVLNAGSGATDASRTKFPRSILPRTFDYGFATGLMVKDVRLYVEEAKALGLPIATDLKIQELDAVGAARLGVRSLEHWYGVPDAAIPGPQNFPVDYSYDDELDHVWA